ncbi:MAG: 2,4-dihydroxyhept-2-ene-1,7-dioic acid aldolase [Hyphomicrobiales bacterium]|nr:2,4-dihydroxyhept-2-ene-1,7-dioic acid aldolase [Hyphomicrobiales bacterium]MCP4998813.1 2,4-dihydroxyhept-2-ene-1,7-dioic acid aldolase [Hyphomicrobiales bacterium]
MLKNKVKQLWADGHPVLHGWLSVGNPFTAEIMAAQGYDAISVDIQHGALDYSSVLPMYQAMRASRVALGARVPWLDPAMIMKVLDAGALNVICPMINTPEQASEFGSYVRYPPAGSRSFGPTRANFALGDNIAGEANDEIVALAMVETRQAMTNLEAIAATPGLDGLYIGPADLTFALFEGRLAPGFDREEPEMIEAIQKILAVCKNTGIRAALHCGTAEYAARAVDWGFDMCTVSGDSRLLAGAAAASVTRFRELTDDTRAGSTVKGGY